MSGKLINMHIFLGFEPFLLSNCEAERKIIVPKPHVKVHMAGTIDVVVRI